MSDQKDYVVFIPARGGSKGIPGKNIKFLNGKPLLAWSVEQALQCSKVRDVYISTDCMDIKRVAESYGASVPFMRPSEISGDHASTESAVLHFIEWMLSQGVQVKNIILLQATSPLRHKNSLSQAIEYYENGNYDSLLTVSKTHKFIWKNLEKPEANYDFFHRPRRQDILPKDEIYFENGSFYITNVQIYQQFQNRLGGKVGMYEMTPEESFEIDDMLDFRIVEFLMKEYNQ